MNFFCQARSLPSTKIMFVLREFSQVGLAICRDIRSLIIHFLVLMFHDSLSTAEISYVPMNVTVIVAGM